MELLLTVFGYILAATLAFVFLSALALAVYMSAVFWRELCDEIRRRF